MFREPRSRAPHVQCRIAMHVARGEPETNEPAVISVT
jgi:hypothetical protein